MSTACTCSWYFPGIGPCPIHAPQPSQVGRVEFQPAMTGWQCPKCLRVYAPSVTECARCNDFQLKPLSPHAVTCVRMPQRDPPGGSENV